ncbi:MAG TPA: bifunctional folylpolyglutamate synthase/dihydrofolate synthase, partial [Azospirillaceae bacterium]|nr:bifunctional folylpolyglutamate synthase/dihydrofolate synthase [Azospirillaceae bacterium]
MVEMLARLGAPHRRLAPVIHVAGTNGKCSTVAYLRAIFATAGLKAHAFTSPHLISVRECVRLAGRLIDDAALADAFARVEAA